MRPFRYRLAFTLIEIMVVIAIIGLFTSVIVVSIASARARARDTKRIEEIQQVINALYLFYYDHGRFPDGDDCIGATNCLSVLGECIGGECGGNSGAGKTNILGTLLAPYINEIPKDPLHNCPDDQSAAQIGATGICDNSFFYAYDYSHALGIWDPTTKTCRIVPDTEVKGDSITGVVVVSINRLETSGKNRRETCYGVDMNIDDADYNVVLCRNNVGTPCFSTIR